MSVITISKQYGCAAEEITRRVCVSLGYQYFDKRNILLMAEEAGLSDKDLFDITVDDLEKRDLMRKVVTESADTSKFGKMPNLNDHIDQDYALSMVQSILQYAAKRGNMVIAGRGGQALFRNTPDVFHFRIIAPVAKRIDYVSRSEGLGRSEAQKMVKKHDSAAAGYLKKTYGIDWEDPDLYHLVINTGLVDYERAAGIIVDFVKN